MSSSSSLVAATVTSLLALTTPFVPPPGCPRFTTTTIESVDSSSRSIDIDGVAAVLIADDPACFPDGWADVVTESRMDFYPAVCPSGWVYHSIAEAAGIAKSTAFCCDSGYEYLWATHGQFIPDEITNYCGRWTTKLDSNSDPDSHATTATITGVDGAAITDSDAYAYETSTGSTLLVHNAWAITWSASDIPNLTPQPPTLTHRMLIPTWRPGDVVPDGKYDRENALGPEHSPILPESAQWFLMVGIPIIGVFLIGSCIFCCVRHNKHVRARREAALYAAAVAAANANTTGNVIVSVERVADR